MADTSTPQHCPGYANFKSLKAFTCACPKCGEVKEIFSDASIFFYTADF